MHACILPVSHDYSVLLWISFCKIYYSHHVPLFHQLANIFRWNILFWLLYSNSWLSHETSQKFLKAGCIESLGSWLHILFQTVSIFFSQVKIICWYVSVLQWIAQYPAIEFALSRRADRIDHSGFTRLQWRLRIQLAHFHPLRESTLRGICGRLYPRRDHRQRRSPPPKYTLHSLLSKYRCAMHTGSPFQNRFRCWSIQKEPPCHLRQLFNL